MAKSLFPKQLLEFFSVTKNEAVAVLIILCGLFVGVAVRYNPFVETHPSQYNPALAEKIYTVLDSIADAEEQSSIGVESPKLEKLVTPDTTKATEKSPLNRDTAGKKEPEQKVNIANVLKAELIRLPGIGEVMADRIIEYRKTQPFTCLQDLMNVKGIGNKKFEKLEPFIVFEKKK